MYVITSIEILSNGSSLLYTDECVQEAFFTILRMCGGWRWTECVSGVSDWTHIWFVGDGHQFVCSTFTYSPSQPCGKIFILLPLTCLFMTVWVGQQCHWFFSNLLSIMAVKKQSKLDLSLMVFQLSFFQGAASCQPFNLILFLPLSCLLGC